MLILDADTGWRSTARGNLRGSEVTVEAIDVTPDGPNTANAGGGQLVVGVGREIQYMMYTTISNITGKPTLVMAIWHLYQYGEIGGVEYNATTMRWWRIREQSGYVVFEVSRDSARWYTLRDVRHVATDEMIGGMQVVLQHIGTRAAGPVRFANLSQNYPADPDPSTPRLATLALMGADPDAIADRPGTTPLICVIDQGTTAAARAAHNVTLVDRYYAINEYYNEPNPTVETWPGQTHGTLCMACAIPPGGRLLDAHIWDPTGQSFVTFWVAAMRWAADRGAEILSMSFGGFLASRTDDDAFRDLNARGVQCFIATGNNGTNTLMYPAAYSYKYPNVISVGANDELTGLRARFSNYADYMTGLAPGQSVAGILPNGMRVTWSGTSAAAPHAANLCARLMHDGRYSAQAAAAALKATRRRTLDPDPQQGGGAFDFAAAKAYLTAQDEQAKLAGLRGVDRGQVVSGAVVPVATWNAMAQRIDDLGVSTQVRRTSVLFLAAGVEQALVWQQEAYRTRRGMWAPTTPDRVTCILAGRFLVVATVRFGVSGGSTVGTRAARLCVNGTTAGATQVGDRVAASSSAAGTTITLRRTVDCQVGDTLQVLLSSTVAVAAGHQDRGGTHLFVTYLGGAGSLPPIVDGGGNTVEPVAALEPAGAGVP